MQSPALGVGGGDKTRCDQDPMTVSPMRDCCISLALDSDTKRFYSKAVGHVTERRPTVAH